MPADYIPSTDAGLLAWSANFSAQLTAAPTAVGLVAGDATAYAALHTDFSTKLTAATDPGTKTQATVAAKNTSRAALVLKARQLAGKIQAFEGTSDAERATFGLTIPDGTPAALPAPASKPVLSVGGITPGQHTLRIVDELTPSSRAKPAGTHACEVYVKIGETPPGSRLDCVYQGHATRNTFNVSHSPADAGKKAWYLAHWINSRGQRGPVSAVVSGTIAA